MSVTINNLKNTFIKLGYTWYTDRPNLIGIRTTIIVPNIFNDLFCMIWTQESMPDGLNDIQKQTWLKNNLFFGKDGGELKIDGNFGTNSNYALNTYNTSVGTERIFTWTITTDPGTYWLNHPMNNLGCAILKPNQYKDCWSLGLHLNQKNNFALVQTGKVTVYRDNDKDGIPTEGGKEDTGLFGINIHRSNTTGKTPTIGKWSAGCQVFQQKIDHDKMLSICNQYKTRINNKFTYTLIREKDIN